MNQSIKPALKLLAMISLPIIIFAGFYLQSINEFSLVNMVLAVIFVPIGLILFILVHRNEGDVRSYMSEEKKSANKGMNPDNENDT